VRIHYIPHFCNHCRQRNVHGCLPRSHHAPGGRSCDRPGEVQRLQSCLTDCPYGAIYFNDALRIAQKCTAAPTCWTTAKAAR
jgi:nitrate reductase beta subunit